MNIKLVYTYYKNSVGHVEMHGVNEARPKRETRT